MEIRCSSCDKGVKERYWTTDLVVWALWRFASVSTAEVESRYRKLRRAASDSFTWHDSYSVVTTRGPCLKRYSLCSAKYYSIVGVRVGVDVLYERDKFRAIFIGSKGRLEAFYYASFFICSLLDLHFSASESFFSHHTADDKASFQ